MPDVWAHCNSDLNRDLDPVVERPNGRWRHVKNFATPGELHAWLASLNIEEQVGTLVINSHGDFGGEVLLDRRLTHQSSEQLFIERFRPLGRYLTRAGHLWFTGCAMANMDAGTQLMSLISGQLPGRVIVGHDRLSYNATTGVGYAAGNVRMRDLIPITDPSQADLLDQRVSELHPAAKWMRNQRVIRYPRDEQRTRDRMRCAYPHCPGHSDPVHQCDGSWDSGCQWRGAPRTSPVPGNPSFLYWSPDDPHALLSPGSSAGRQPMQGGNYRTQGPIGQWRHV